MDPVTHEVLRHALWNVNIEHGNMIMRISGSPICAYGHDFNPVHPGRGRGLRVLRPVSAVPRRRHQLGGEMDAREPLGEPGHRGRRHLHVQRSRGSGATHQSDVGVVAPVFVDGRIFCWVANTLHQWDLGGSAPGGFNPMAADVLLGVPLHPPGEDRRGRCDAARHRGAVHAALAPAPAGGARPARRSHGLQDGGGADPRARRSATGPGL